MPFRTTLNSLFNDIWYCSVIGCFDWKIGLFQQAVVRVYCILNKRSIKSWFQSDILLVTLPNWSEDLFDIKKVTNTIPQICNKGPFWKRITIDTLNRVWT